ncbi:MAG: beta-N-acetylhexosaminidase [Faecousia sp.]
MKTDLERRISIGQRLIAGFPGQELDDRFIRLVKEYKIGNVILFRHNIRNKYQLQQLCQDIQSLIQSETGYPAFITIDQEGGVVTRLSDDATNVAGAMAVAQTGDAENAYALGRITGCELRAMGINFDLAPDMDINSNPGNPVIGVRSYGEDPQTVIRYSTKMMQGLHDGGVLTCAKHFPGHGDTDVDSHLDLPRVEKTLEELEKMELLPFRHAIQQGVDSIMIAHILFPKIEPQPVPATMSRKLVTDLLRQKLHFEGLILSDCMEMNAISKFYGTAAGVKDAFRAGVDLAFISHYADVAEQAAILTAAALESGELDQAEHTMSVQRILRFKRERLDFVQQDIDLVGCDAHRTQNLSVIRKSILVKTPLARLGASPLFIGCAPFRATEASNQEQDCFSFSKYLCSQKGGCGLQMSHDPDDTEIDALVSKAASASAAVIGTYQGHLHRRQLEVVNRIAALGIPTICVALRNSYDVDLLPERIGKICTYEYSQASIQAVAALLRS